MKLFTQLKQQEKEKLIADGKATIENGLVVYRHQTLAGKPAVKIWTLKSSKPVSNYYFATTEQMEKHIQEKKDQLKTHQDYLTKRKIEMKSRNQDVHVGDILHKMWGYSMTLNDFYQVVRETPGMLYVREIADQYVESDQSGSQGKVVPVKNQFKGELVKAMKRSAAPSKWDGKPAHENHND